jgi:transposase-like protein
MLKLDNLIDDAKCFEAVRQLRWPEGVKCVWCQSSEIKKRGHDERQHARQRYHCNACQRDFDDLTDSIFAQHHQPLRKWILCLYLMGLNLSNEQIAQEIGLHKDDVQQMTVQLRSGIVARKPEPQLEGVVECDEVYVVAGHKGHPEAVKKKADPDAAGA